jgi:teichoic acid transport system permease protein
VTLGGPDHQGSLPGPDAADAAELARRYGLQPMGVRPPLGRYIRDVWDKRHFLVTLSAANFVSRHQNNYLGQLWAVLNPLLLGLAYFLIFGLLLGTREGTENYIGFLTIGLFGFMFLSAGFNYAAKALVDQLSLVRALQFPRALMPISVVLTELFASLPAFVLLILIALLTGETPQWKWLLFPVAILVIAVTTTGLGLLSARFVHGARDLANLIPLLTRMLRYVSGVFFSIATYASGLMGDILAYQPVAVSLTMMRECLLAEAPLSWQTWAWSAGWAVGLFSLGFVVFWRAEATYGRG